MALSHAIPPQPSPQPHPHPHSVGGSGPLGIPTRDPFAAILQQLAPGEWVTYYRVYDIANTTVWILALCTLPVLLGFLLVALALQGHKQILRGVLLTNRRLFVVDAHGQVRQVVLHEVIELKAVRKEAASTGQGALANAAARGIVSAMHNAADRHPPHDPRHWSPAMGMRIVTTTGMVDAVLPPVGVDEICVAFARSLGGGGDQLPAVDASGVATEDAAILARRTRRHRGWLLAVGGATAMMVVGLVGYGMSDYVSAYQEAAENRRRWQDGAEERHAKEADQAAFDDHEGADRAVATLERRGYEKTDERTEPWAGMTLHRWSLEHDDRDYEVLYLDTLQSTSEEELDVHAKDGFIVAHAEMPVATRPDVLNALLHATERVDAWETKAEEHGWSLKRKKGPVKDKGFGLKSFTITLSHPSEESLVLHVLDLTGWAEHTPRAMHSINIFETIFVRGDDEASADDCRELAETADD